MNTVRYFKVLINYFHEVSDIKSVFIAGFVADIQT